MRSRPSIINRLTAIDGYERHKAVELLLRTRSPNQILDAGGISGALARFMPEASVMALNIDSSGDVIYGGGAFPFPSASFDAVVSLDTLEHLHPKSRRAFVNECVRTAKEFVIIAAPYGSAGHAAYEVKLDDLYEQIYGLRHRWLHEHVVNGLPSEGDLGEYRQLMIGAGFAVHTLYAGNYAHQCRVFERSLRMSGRLGPARRIGDAYHLLASLALWYDIVFHKSPYAEANRFYLVAQRHDRSTSLERS